MKRLRRIHLLVGCFVAPFTLFFATTGVLQAFGYHRGLKDGSYVPSAEIVMASSVHRNEYFRSVAATPTECASITDEMERIRCRERVQTRKGQSIPARLFRLLVLLGGGGIALNAFTGVLMALQMKAWRTYAIVLLVLGLMTPAMLLLF